MSCFTSQRCSSSTISHNASCFLSVFSCLFVYFLLCVHLCMWSPSLTPPLPGLHLLLQMSRSASTFTLSDSAKGGAVVQRSNSLDHPSVRPRVAVCLRAPCSPAPEAPEVRVPATQAEPRPRQQQRLLAGPRPRSSVAVGAVPVLYREPQRPPMEPRGPGLTVSSPRRETLL